VFEKSNKYQQMKIKEYRVRFTQELTPIYDEGEVESFFYLILENKHQLKRIDLALNPDLEFSDSEMQVWNGILEQLKKEGEQGRKVINQYTRYLTVFLAALQSWGIAIGLQGAGFEHGFETIGGFTYLPPREVTTEQVLKGCRIKLDFPLQRMTGIQTRRMAGETEFAIDLAAKATMTTLQIALTYMLLISLRLKIAFIILVS
jgi:hypothetical protein